MHKFSNGSFQKRLEYIRQVGGQFAKRVSVEVQVGGKPLKIDYRFIFISSLCEKKENKNLSPIILLPGFGSGWEGIAHLAFSLACEGRKVLILSLPGYGNSDKPPLEYEKNIESFPEVEVVRQVTCHPELVSGSRGIKNRRCVAEGILNRSPSPSRETPNVQDDSRVGGYGKFDLIGHSMGGEILTVFAAQYPEKVRKLVLLNPVIRDKDSLEKLTSRFIFWGLYDGVVRTGKRLLSRSKDVARQLDKYIPKTPSPYFPLKHQFENYRVPEIKRCVKGYLLKYLEKVQCPVIYIGAGLDRVGPPGKENDEQSQINRIKKAVKNKHGVKVGILAGLGHNTTVGVNDVVAKRIVESL